MGLQKYKSLIFLSGDSVPDQYWEDWSEHEKVCYLLDIASYMDEQPIYEKHPWGNGDLISDIRFDGKHLILAERYSLGYVSLTEIVPA